MSSLLPTIPGLLPWWQLIVSITATLNSAQAYTGTHATARVYSNDTNKEVTRLQARTFGTWTFLSAIIRFYGAYYLNDPHVYDLTLASYLVAFGHFMSEFLIFKTVKLSGPSIAPMIVSTSSIIWMVLQRDWYLS
ncbi:Ergosterol biosynthetic protein 28 [Yarrowia sp. C11]|nr:Ergosterol biosynthetic protein 28 [Yarrowia sp. C11]KAG5364892.1 Ergosterol biosynthetic protein 28 [Yarrowia sp. E02]